MTNSSNGQLPCDYEKYIIDKDYLGHDLYLFNSKTVTYKCNICKEMVELSLNNNNRIIYSYDDFTTTIPLLTCNEYLIKKLLE